MLQSNERIRSLFSPKSRKQNDKISNFQYSILGSMTPIFFFFFPSEGNKKCVHGLSGRKYWGRSAGGNPIGLSASSAAGAPAGAWCWPGPSASAEKLRRGGAWGLAPRGGQAEKRRQAPEGSTLPSFTPSPRRSPEGNRRGATRRDWGEGGGLRPQREKLRRPRVAAAGY